MLLCFQNIRCHEMHFLSELAKDQVRCSSCVSYRGLSMTSHLRRTHLDIFCKLCFAPGFLPAPLRNLGHSSYASSRIPTPGSALPHIRTHGCGCGCTPASQTEVPCTLGCSTHTHHWCASCLYKSGQGRGHTVSSFSRYSAALGRCQEDICHTGSDARFLRHNEGTLEELVPGWSTQGCPGAPKVHSTATCSLWSSENLRLQPLGQC